MQNTCFCRFHGCDSAANTVLKVLISRAATVGALITQPREEQSNLLALRQKKNRAERTFNYYIADFTYLLSDRCA
jgi:hypothetical protein